MNYGMYKSEILYEERPYKIMNLVHHFFVCYSYKYGNWKTEIILQKFVM